MTISLIESVIGASALLVGLYVLFSVAWRVGMRVAARRGIPVAQSAPVWYRRDLTRCVWGTFALGVAALSLVSAMRSDVPAAWVLRVAIFASLVAFVLL